MSVNIFVLWLFLQNTKCVLSEDFLQLLFYLLSASLALSLSLSVSVFFCVCMCLQYVYNVYASWANSICLLSENIFLCTSPTGISLFIYVVKTWTVSLFLCLCFCSLLPPHFFLPFRLKKNYLPVYFIIALAEQRLDFVMKMSKCSPCLCSALPDLLVIDHIVMQPATYCLNHSASLPQRKDISFIHPHSLNIEKKLTKMYFYLVHSHLKF